MYIQFLNMVIGAVAVNLEKPVTVEFVASFTPEFKRVIVDKFSEYCKNALYPQFASTGPHGLVHQSFRQAQFLRCYFL